MFKLTVLLVVLLFYNFSSSFVIESKIDSSELSEARTIDKSFKILYDLHKMFNLFQKKHSFKVPPLDGVLYRNPKINRRVHSIDHFPTLAELNKEEEMMNMMKPPKKMTDMKEVSTENEPFFWPFDKFSKKMDLVLLTKILLKIIIFKKIIKFIALVCLLFFIPAIKDTSENESEERDSRHFLQTYGELKLF